MRRKTQVRGSVNRPETGFAMPIHDWTRVDAGIFHAFHLGWIFAISDALNKGLLPSDYYALPEQHAVGFEADVLTLQARPAEEDGDEAAWDPGTAGDGSAVLAAAPTIAPTAETDLEFYRRKQNALVVRHVSGDRVVAIVEIVWPGNKSSRHAVEAFVAKAAAMLDRNVHLLVIDLHPPSRRDPQGMHAAVWEEVSGQEYALPAGKPFTMAAYEVDLSIRCYVRHAAVGERLPEIPLFLKPKGCVQAPLDSTYEAAFAAMPRRWRQVLEKT
jgi:hypothetical protein